MFSPSFFESYSFSAISSALFAICVLLIANSAEIRAAIAEQVAMSDSMVKSGLSINCVTRGSPGLFGYIAKRPLGRRIIGWR